MKFAKFIYTDVKNKVSNREVLLISEPSNKYNAIDLGELCEEDQAQFCGEMLLLHEDYIKKVEKLKESFDLKYKFRQFLADKVSNLETEELT